MNQVNLMGRLTKDPVIKYSGMAEPLAITSYTLAVDRSISRERRNAGEQSADFISCTAFGKSAEFVEKYFRKGMMVGVGGRLQVKSYEDSEGQRRWITEVVTDSHHFAGDKRGFTDEPS